MRYPREGIIVVRCAGCDVVAAIAWMGSFAMALLAARYAGACFIQLNQGWW
jgi:hypothetical protein